MSLIDAAINSARRGGDDRHNARHRRGCRLEHYTRCRSQLYRGRSRRCRSAREYIDPNVLVRGRVVLDEEISSRRSPARSRGWESDTPYRAADRPMTVRERPINLLRGSSPEGHGEHHRRREKSACSYFGHVDKPMHSLTFM